MKTETQVALAGLRRLANLQFDMPGRTALGEVLIDFCERLETDNSDYINAAELSAMSDQKLRLLFGEMSTQEIITVRAVLDYIINHRKTRGE